MKKYLFTILPLALLFSFAETASAQWSIGASYEIRDEDPTNGFGLRIERDILSSAPLLDLNLRAHFSYFNESNNISLTDNDGTPVRVGREFTVYDFGLAGVAGLKIGLVKPYVGLGIGVENFDLDAAPQVPDEANAFTFRENNFYWNGFGGAELMITPLISPFIEYRIARLTGTDDVTWDNVGRLAIGINLRF